MKPSIKYFLIVIAIVLALIILFLSIPREEKPFNQVDLSIKTNTVLNSTGISYYDTILHVGLSEAGLENLILSVYPLSENAIQNFREQGGDLAAHVREQDGYYYLFISPTSKSESITIIAHEIIHVLQYESDRLKFSDGLVTWEGETYLLNELKYDFRPWEAEAFNQERKLANQISSILY
jgi:uncharacterized protein YjaZ